MRFSKPVVRAALVASVLGAALPTTAAAQCGCPSCSPRPYGAYCDRPQSGAYGARRAVATAEEAGRLLREFYRDRPLTVGEIVEKRWYYEAEIMDAKKQVVVRVIVDKRTGRNRSM